MIHPKPKIGVSLLTSAATTLGLLFFCLFPSLAHGAINGIVETTSGARLEGQLRIEPGTFVVTGTNGTVTDIALKDLKAFRVTQSDAKTNNLTILSAPPEHGLLGIYFNTPDCTEDFARTRYDPVIDFDWGQSAPLPGINSNGFSVRWMGSLVVSNTEHYTFHTVTDDGVRLWVNKRLVIDAWKDEILNLAAPPIILVGGQTNELRMEMYDARDRAVARLFWSSPTTPRGIIPTDRLFPASNVDLPSARRAKPLYPAGVLTINGSVVPGQIESADRSSVRIAGAPLPLSSIQVARLIFKPVTAYTETNFLRGRVGVLLKGGDFVEGEFAGLKGGEVEINSVILGSKKVSLAQAVAVILREARTLSVKFEITTRNNGLYRVNTLRLQKDSLLLSDLTLPSMTLPAAEVLEITQGLTTR
jgi:hypothetical protein